VKRFWEQAQAAPAADGGGYVILLDGRPMRLPGGATLTVPGARLAAAIAAEWQAAGGGRGGEMSFSDTPLTRLAGTAQERILADPAATVQAIARYAQSDLLCYRAERPAELVQRQARVWQPWLDWAARTHDAVLKVTTGIIYTQQDARAVAALQAAVARCSPLVLAGLGLAVPAMGSLVLGLALADRALGAEDAFAAAALDELFQAEQWGEDAEAAARRAQVAADIALAARFMGLAEG
jgi:chaperone required for assembly of F1-ATPase